MKTVKINFGFLNKQNSFNSDSTAEVQYESDKDLIQAILQKVRELVKDKQILGVYALTIKDDGTISSKYLIVPDERVFQYIDNGILNVGILAVQNFIQKADVYVKVINSESIWTPSFDEDINNYKFMGTIEGQNSIYDDKKVITQAMLLDFLLQNIGLNTEEDAIFIKNEDEEQRGLARNFYSFSPINLYIKDNILKVIVIKQKEV